ncbi:integrase core domain protein [Lasius niger]|uniref:Integrase core domain protein n=1 Tax=Lasius niger TaxID=67767 RepID=A0A0J7K9V7_LASNI|nr:integrase core domain protein [Lasius niger]
MELFFTSEKMADETIATHVGRLQRNFRELNDELKKLGNSELPEILLTSRIMSTLPFQYFEFKSVWESVPVETRTVNLLLERKRKEKKCFICHETGHQAKHCPEKLKKKKQIDSKKNLKTEGNAFVAVVNRNDNRGAFYTFVDSVMEQDVWLADSRASTHMTSCERYFATYEAFPTSKAVQVGNKDVILAYGKGTINVEMKIKDNWYRNHLLNVWYVSKIGRNLFSISQNIDIGFSFKADRRGCIFIKDGKIRLVGRRTSNHLYALQMRVLVPEKAVEVHVASTESTLQLWHERLGHQAKSHVKRILLQKGIKVTVDDEFCKGCVLGKHARASFRDKLDRSTQPGELIHADVCGPMQEQSIGGSRYFVCFKDDFSKYRRVFFLKEKSEVAGCLSTFLNETSVAGHVVKELLCDGGKKFDNTELKKILESKGIHFRKSMSYTPEQNGAAERENRILVESGRTMIHTKSLPIKLWAEAVNTAAYVLNRTGPTPVKLKSPIELWNKKAVNFDHLKVFGTECFVHLPKQKRQKFDQKSNKGYLVGYCETVIQKRLELVINSNTDTGSNRNDQVDDMETASEDNTGDNDVYEEAIEESDHEDDSSLPIALRRNEAQEWKKAMDDEMFSLAENNTWELVNPPKGKRIVQNRWVLRVKTTADGTRGRFKAWLVAKGYTQKAGIDYDETFSPVARYDTVRAILSVSAAENLKLLQFDIKTAFLNGDLKEEVYMKQPEGYNDGTDDGLVAGSDKREIDLFVSELKKEFKVTIGFFDSFLGIQIKQLKDGSIFLTQRLYFERILEKFGMAQSKPVSTPIEGQIMNSDSEEALEDQVPYRQAVGSLMYLMTATRPDLAYALSIVSTKLDSPTQADWMAVKRVYRYLKGTINYGLLFQKNCKEKELRVFSDSDFARDPITKHSRTGIVSVHLGAAISWLSQRQRCVTLSSTEAEYVAASEGTKELIWLRCLLNEVTNISYTPTLLVDNVGAIKLAKNPEFHKRTKHAEVKYHFVREKYQEGAVCIEHANTEDIIADIMTKPLGRQKFEKFRHKLGLVDETSIHQLL